MPKIINAYSDGNGSIADSLKSIGESIWGNEARNEGQRQNALKLQRENSARDEGSLALQRGDAIEALRQGYRGGMSAPDATGYLRGYYGNTKGADSPEFEGAAVGAGEPWQNTPRGRRETLEVTAPRFSPVMGEDQYGAKSPAGAFNTRTGEYAPFQKPGLPGAQPRVGFQPTAADEDQPYYGGSEDGTQNPLAGGGEYLRTLPPGRAAVIVGILDGRAPPPTGNAALHPRNQRLLEDLARVEPGFDFTKWVERYKTAQDFSSAGMSGKAVKSANQAITHAGELAAAAEGLHNKEGLGPITQAYNSIGNAYHNASGEVGTGPFELARNAFADEISKVFRTTGMSDHEIEQWKQTINSSQSPTQLRANMAQAIRLYQGAVDALEANRTRGMGTFRQQPPLLDQRTQDTMRRIDAWTKGGPWQGAPMKEQAQHVNPQPPVVTPQTQAGPGPTGQFNDRFNAANNHPPPGFKQGPDGRFYSEQPGPSGKYQVWTP